MVKDQSKKRKQDLGIFYTPQEVVDFIFDVLNIWKDKEDKEKHRWQTRKPKPHFPSVIDPACGEGIFLKKAVDSDFTAPKYIWGVDLDEKVKEEWKKITLLKSFGSKANLDFHFYHQDGLLPIPEKKVGHKKGGMNQYDAVVGNPPYGGIGIHEITSELEKALFDFQIWGLKFQKNQKNTPGNLNLFETTIPRQFKEKIENFPIEILFIDRFIQLAKPGGWIAIIIPDGILTNSNSHYVREFISHKTKVEAIVSLPRNTFKEVGTSAKTSILFLRKLKKDEKPEENYPVFLASLEKIDKKYLGEIVNSYEKFYNAGGNYMNTSNLIQITKDQKGRELVAVRADKTLKNITQIKPASRWDPDYWHPKYESVLSKMSPKFQLQALKELLTESIIAPDHVRASKGESIGPQFDCEYRTLKDLMFTGLNYADINYCSDNAFNRLKRSQLKINDILFAGSGIGAIGRVGIVLKVQEKSCVGDLFIIRNIKINSSYLLVFLLTKFGQLQIKRIFHGIQSAKISTDEIATILIPVLPLILQNNIEEEYKIMSSYHNKAMEAKKKGDEKGYKENLETAEEMLKDLIKRTDEVIEGKREDVN